jgi:hypothetical protein
MDGRAGLSTFGKSRHGWLRGKMDGCAEKIFAGFREMTGKVRCRTNAPLARMTSGPRAAVTEGPQW